MTKKTSKNTDESNNELPVQTFFVPSAGRSIEATTPEEAVKKATEEGNEKDDAS